MLLLNKTQESARLILTLTESSSETLFDLVAHSFYTNKTYTFPIGEDVSEHPNRYNEFILETSVFNDMEAGRYTYEIKEKLTDVTIERGVLMVQGEPEREYVVITPDETDDDYVVYEIE